MLPYVNKKEPIAKRLQSTYGHVDRIDAYVSLILENVADTGQFHVPQTASAIILEQFRRTRAADRWFYENAANPHLDFSPEERERIGESVAESLALSYGITGVEDAFEARNR